MTVRVRYAPSPTGEPHVGNIRSALFNWLYARHAGGSFIVRIEDTDQSRLVPGAMDAILDALSWLGLDWDEGPGKDGAYGPYVQSERLPLYQEHAERLVAEGKAYLCYCSEERIDQVRREKQAKGDRSGYDRRCRDPIEAEKAKAENPNPVVRFKTPLEGSSTVDDFVRGPVTFDVSLLDDFVLLKSDGFPTYHLANVVDDHAMEITHVMRAEEWLPSAPRHQMLYEALGYDMPHLVHLPIILGPDRAKLSKRHGATSVLQFRDDGYLPDAMLNFLALLGWSLDETSELFSRDELIEHFTLERILSSSAVFNHEKLDWFNGVYIRRMGDAELADAITPWLDSEAGGLPRERSSGRPRLSLLDRSAGARAAEEALGRAGDAVVLLPGASGVRRCNAGAEGDGRGGHAGSAGAGHRHRRKHRRLERGASGVGLSRAGAEPRHQDGPTLRDDTCRGNGPHRRAAAVRHAGRAGQGALRVAPARRTRRAVRRGAQA